MAFCSRTMSNAQARKMVTLVAVAVVPRTNTNGKRCFTKKEKEHNDKQKLNQKIVLPAALSNLSQAKLKSYARRGLPDSLRQKAWTTLTEADTLMAASPGMYKQLVSKANVEYNKMKELESAGDTTSISKVGSLLETVERDIHRTFPRHYLFHSGFDEEDENELNGNQMNSSDNNDMPSDDDDEIGDNGEDDNTSSDNNVAQVIESKKREFKVDFSNELLDCCNGGETPNDDALLVGFGKRGSNNNCTQQTTKDSEAALRLGHGQDALRNILRAYNMYDTTVGYCQGMNYIVAMFLTFLNNDEESSFWLLVVTMNHQPYKLCDLFGEDMAGTHEVLYIAEKLINKFLPELYKHFEEQGVHVSMFITEWLVTIYVSKFPFELVARVWDCFLVEGWKVVYRVMLSLLDHASKDLLGLKFEGILNYFREFPKRVDGRTIMEGSLQIGLKRKHIQNYGNEWRMHASNGGR